VTRLLLTGTFCTDTPLTGCFHATSMQLTNFHFRNHRPLEATDVFALVSATQELWDEAVECGFEVAAALPAGGTASANARTEPTRGERVKAQINIIRGLVFDEPTEAMLSSFVAQLQGHVRADQALPILSLPNMPGSSIALPAQERSSSKRSQVGKGVGGQKKRAKMQSEAFTPVPPAAYAPNAESEVLFCICKCRVTDPWYSTWGDMIKCQGGYGKCPNNEWLHLACVGLDEKRLGDINKWLCALCSVRLSKK